MYDLTAMIARIKDLKKQKDYSNETLAIRSGIPKGTLAKILGGETKDPQITSVIKIAQALGVSADYLIYGEIRYQAEKYDLPPDEDILLAKYRTLTQEGKNYVNQQMDIAAQIYKKADPALQREDKIG